MDAYPRPSSSRALATTAAPPPQPAEEPRYLLRPKPDTLKLRKRADYHTESREFTYGMMCRDQLLRGDITLNMPQQQVEYRKRLPLAGGAVLALNASCRLEGQRLRPDAGLTVEFGTHSGPRGDGGAVYVADAGGGGSFDVHHRFKVARGLALEVCGNVRLPSPAARYSPESGQLVLGEGGFHLHVAQVNAVVHV
ncbi:expressed protein [Chlorella variabilis]|uniref:Expressed protein n=1 Tax=Chlorella variabilis TaxID=554065 RepID=E1ZBM3_CHLVA|nr:expressed protein [Chlorella variabilis]EFN56880.1 expressed protein [Chlorella variabilis]|eukprot:XP_005848982.1 expressed protein [Chlorella variabilis]